MSLAFNPTQFAGIVAFLTASASCFLFGSRKLWQILAIVYLLFAVEIWLGLRHAFRAMLIGLMQSADIYVNRFSLQLVLFAGLLGAVIWLAVSVGRRPEIRSLAPTAALGLLATVFVLFLFAIELISVHFIDVALYKPVGGIMVIGWCWIISAGLLSATALASHRKPEW